MRSWTAHPAPPAAASSPPPNPPFLSPHQGGVDLLVDLLVTADAYTAEAARYCLLSLRRGNTKNQAETIAAIRANSNVVRNVRRVDPELLRFEEGTPRVKSSYAPPPMSPAALGYGYGTPTKALARPTTADRCGPACRRKQTSI